MPIFTTTKTLAEVRIQTDIFLLYSQPYILFDASHLTSLLPLEKSP